MTPLFFTIVSFLAVQEQGVPKSYTAREVIELAVVKGLENNIIKTDHFRFKKVEKEEKLNNDESVKSLEKSAVYLVFKQGEEAVEQLIEKDGETIEDGETEIGLSNPGGIDFNKILLEKYEFKISTKIPLFWQNKLGIYLIDFYPKTTLKLLV